MPGDQCARSLACENKKHDELVTTVTPVSPGIPRAMVLTVSFALFPVTGLFCHRRLRDCRRKLDASVGASEPHDFAVRRPSPQKPLDGPGTGRDEASAKADQAPLVSRHPASIASRPAFVTIASRPSCRGGTIRLNKAASTPPSSTNSENQKL